MHSIRQTFLAVSAALLTACGGDGAAGPTQVKVLVRFVHAVADTSALDVRVNTRLTLKLTGVVYGAATDYDTVASNSVTVTSQPSPSTSVDAPRSIASIRGITVPNGAAVTFVAGGQARDTVGAAAAGVTAYLDDLSAPASGQARLRVINASSDAGAVDVYLTPTAGVVPATPTFAGVDYKSQVNQTVAPGAYTVTITPLGERTTVLGTSSVTLPAGGVQTLVVRGFAGALPAGLPSTRRIAATVMVNVAP